MVVVIPVEPGCSLYEEDIACSQSEVCIKDGMSCVFIETTLNRFRFFKKIFHRTVQEFDAIELFERRCMQLWLESVGAGDHGCQEVLIATVHACFCHFDLMLVVPSIVEFDRCSRCQFVGPVVNHHLHGGHRKWAACCHTRFEDLRCL